MQRREVLAGGLALSFVLAGCLDEGGSGDGTETAAGTPSATDSADETATSPTPTATQSPSPSATAAGTSVRVVARAEQPDVPVEFAVEMAASTATADRPARVRVTISNSTDSTVVLGEERAVSFHHVASTDESLYLHPAGDDDWAGPVEPGCWRLTEHVAVPEYYGTIALDAGESVRAESHVYGHPDLPEGRCLPDGEHRIQTAGTVGDEEAFENDETTDFDWGFTLRIGEGS